MTHDAPLIRLAEFPRDRAAVDRIMIEVGWQKPGEPAERAAPRARFQEATVGYVAEAAGEAECFVSTADGSYQYHSLPLAFVGVTGVVTSRVARRQGLASRTTARALAHRAREGAVVAGLGIFDQGFYNKLGFGTAACDHHATLDPALLSVPPSSRAPVRLTPADAAEMHAARLVRRRCHGAVSISSDTHTAFRAHAAGNDFGLGFRDPESGRLTHHLWITTENVGSGPYSVMWTAFESVSQFVELLSLIRDLGDQVYTVTIGEPSGVQLQDYLVRPFRRNRQGRRGEHETTTIAVAHFQYRILDLTAAFAATAARSAAPLPSCTLRVHDPVERYLGSGDGWAGLAGDYRVDASGAERLGRSASRVDLEIGVGDLTRAWLGVLPMRTLGANAGFTVPDPLADRFDAAFAGPLPHTDWFY